MASWQETFLSLPIDARRRYAELYCKKGMRAKVGRLPAFNPLQIPKQSKQEILDFAKRHKVVTQDEMYTAIHKGVLCIPLWIRGRINRRSVLQYGMGEK